MNELIKVEVNEKQEQVVSGRELHEFLLVGTEYRHWFPRMCEYGFSEDKDFTPVIFDHPKNNQPTTDHLLKLDMAKEISMLQRTYKGKQARQYFIEVEKKHKNNMMQVQQLSPQLQLLINMELKQKEMEIAVTETKQEITQIRDRILLNPKAEWRKETNGILTSIGKKLDNYSFPRTEVYEALSVRGGCRPNVLINNLKKRALINGMAPSKVEALTILDVLENEPRLKEIYVTIVKEMAIKYAI